MPQFTVILTLTVTAQDATQACRLGANAAAQLPATVGDAAHVQVRPAVGAVRPALAEQWVKMAEDGSTWAHRLAPYIDKMPRRALAEAMSRAGVASTWKMTVRSLRLDVYDAVKAGKLRAADLYELG